jgi:hypothetical protein
MGNFFSLHHITCHECKQLGQTPEWFTKSIYQNHLINDINYVIRYDKYGNEIKKDREKNKIQTEYCCSFGHTFIV